MSESRKKNFVDLTHHLKIWFGKELQEKHILRLVHQIRRNPKHDILLVVNSEVFTNTKPEILALLKKYHIKIADINEITNPNDLEEQKILYVINKMINYGLNNNFLPALAAASDLARWLKSLALYLCDKNIFRVYSDTDYYFYKIPDKLSGEFLFGDYRTSLKEVFFKSAEVMDCNFIGIDPNHPLAKKIRQNWINFFDVNFYPKSYTGPISNSMFDLDDKTLSKPKEELIEIKINDYIKNPGVSYDNVLRPDVLTNLKNPKAILCQRLDEAIILNLSEASWLAKPEPVFKGSLSLDRDGFGNIYLMISKESQFIQELLKNLIRSKVIPDGNILKQKYDNDFKIVIPKDKSKHALELLVAFVEARKLHKHLKGNLKEEVLHYCILSEASITFSFSKAKEKFSIQKLKDSKDEIPCKPDVSKKMGKK